MRYNPTTGRPEDLIIELTVRVNDVFNCRKVPAIGAGGRPRALGLYRQVVLALFLLRRNLIPSVAADLLGLSRLSPEFTVRCCRSLTRSLPFMNSGHCLN